MSSTIKKAASYLLGTRGDWHLTPQWVRAPRLSLQWLGPIAILASVAVSWFAFDGTAGLSPSSSFSMWVGATSILLMSWSFILAVRFRLLERFWGGLDSMYRGHRWAGALSIVFMYLHTSIEPETKGADLVAGASKGVADSAEGLAETGQTLLYVLIGLTLLRLIPYRWWKWTHKLLGIPFAFASWHFFTATKPYENGSPWGWYFGAFMLGGLLAYVLRILVRDGLTQGSVYTVVAAEHTSALTRLELAPNGEPLAFRPGQFAFLRLEAKEMREPHPLSIASGPSRNNLEFYVRHLGDWSDRLANDDLVGSRVRIEGSYGAFEPISAVHQQTLWIAGGVGITPFLAALDEKPPAGHLPPTVLYACTSTSGDPLVDLLERANSAGRIQLMLFTPSNRLTPAVIDELFPNGLGEHHVALCGPAGLVTTMAQAAHRRGAKSIETEDFDIRQGFGPDRSREIDAILSR